MPTISAVIKYATNIDELRRELKAGTDQLVVLEKAAERTTRNLGGEGLMRAAHNAAAAVQQLGGATKLTGAEQERVNNILTRAIEKYQVLGQTAPAAIRKLHEETTKIATVTDVMPAKTTNWTSAVLGLGSALGVTLSVGAVVGAAKEFLRLGDEIQKMADKASVSTDEIQRLDFVASQTGVSIDGMVGAVQNLQQRLGDNDKGAVGALEKLGINLDAFLKLNPYEQFIQLAEAIGKIPDPTQRASIAADVFGKTWKEIGPAIVANIREIADAAPLVAPAVIKASDEAGDAIDKLWRSVKANATNQIGLVILSVQALPKEINMAFKAMHLDVDGAKKDVQDLAVWWDVLVQKVEKPPKVAISQAVKDAFSGAGVPKIRLSADEIKGIENDLDKQRKALDDAAKAADQHAQKIRELAAAYAGTKAINDANDALAAVNQNLDKGIDIAEMTEAQQIALNKVVSAAIDVYRALGREAPQALIDIQQETQKIIDVQDDAKAALDDWAESVRQHQDEYKRGEAETVAFLEQQEQERIDAAKSALDDYSETVRAHQAAQKQGEEETLKALDEQRKRYQEAQKAVRDLGAALAELASVSDGAFGEIINDLSVMIGAFDHAQSSIGNFQGGLASLRSGANLSGILQMASGIMGIASAAIVAGKALANLLDRNKGRDVVVGFAEEHGGFDRLHNELLALGAEGEQLWIRLTQGVGRNNPAQAQAAIDAINEALRRHKDSLDQAAASATQMGQAESEAVRQAREAVQALDSQIASLNQSIANEAPEEEMGIIERNTRARIASLEAERDHAAQTLEELTQNMTDSIHEVADAIRDLPKEIELAIRLSTEIPEPTPGGPTVNVATGGYVTPTGIQRFGGGGIVVDAAHYAGAGIVRFAPQGMDTQPAMLSVGEGVVNVHPGMDLLGPAGLAALNTGKVPTVLADRSADHQRPIRLTTIFEFDRRHFARSMVDVFPNEVRRMGVKTRSS